MRGASIVRSASSFSDLIGTIYDCALDPARWEDVLTCVRRELRFHHSALTLIELRSGAVRLSISSGVSEPWRSRMDDYGSEIVEQWGGPHVILTHPLHEPAVLSRINPAALATGRYRKEWAEPQGLIDVMALVVARDDQAVGSVGLGRHRRDGPIGDEEIEAAALLLPHLQRAITISRLLDLKTATAATFEAVIHELAAAVLLVDAECRVIHANPAAHELLDRADAIRLGEERLRLTRPGADKALAVAIRQAANGSGAIGRKGFNVPVRGDQGNERILHVLPLRPRIERAGTSAAAVAAVFVSPSNRRNGAGADIIAELFDLTPAEARVLKEVVEGKGNAAIAGTLGIGEATVRTHLLRLFEKTGVHRRAELVALVSSFDLPVRSEADSEMARPQQT
ncbi:MAG TPA: helix-turn-helix transcriptional regulator [Sphingomonas sp.]|nr:helix-turn-helix transcriptional regulator [Sphingomonas sp.]